MIPYYNNYFWFYPFLPNNCDLPPTIYSILDSIVNLLEVKMILLLCMTIMDVIQFF